MYDAAMFRALNRIQTAQMAQIGTLANQRSGADLALPTLPSMPRDTVTLSGGLPELGLIPNPLKSNGNFPSDPTLAPYAAMNQRLDQQMAYYDQLLEKIALLKAMQAAQGIKPDKSDNASAQKGDLNVVAGNRNDGVKAKKVTIHESGKWRTRQWDENRADYNRHESKFEGAKVGSYYRVAVEWEDGTTTYRDVQMDEPGKTVVIDNSY